MYKKIYFDFIDVDFTAFEFIGSTCIIYMVVYIAKNKLYMVNETYSFSNLLQFALLPDIRAISLYKANIRSGFIPFFILKLIITHFRIF